MGDVTLTVNGVDIESFSCILDYSGLLQEGPIGGDVIPQEWVDGAIWQRGPSKPYSFDITVVLSPPGIRPTLAGVWAAYQTLLSWRGPLLNLQRTIWDGGSPAAPVHVHSCQAILVSELSPTLRGGRVLKVPLVFQNMSGRWL